MPLIKAGVDAFWPDEGDWFNLYERIKRHQLYYQGHLSAHPNIRPWEFTEKWFFRELHNGEDGYGREILNHPGKLWKHKLLLVLNYSMSIGPYWGSDIGGFYPNEELTGELYARWFQFGAFCASFRSHGVTWRTRTALGMGWKRYESKRGKSKSIAIRNE
jgi:alpha-glucosidase/alpha-D-xyloside xylohydrolase